MNRRQISYSIVVALALTLLSIFFLDQPIAAFVQKVGGRSSVILQQGTSFLEAIMGSVVAELGRLFSLRPVCAHPRPTNAGLVLFAWKSTRSTAWMLLFIGCAQFVTRITAGNLKDVFHRLRPFEVMQAGNWNWKFFGGNAAKFLSVRPRRLFWGLFFPLAFLFPNYRLPFLIVPLFISVARVGVNDHWCS